MKHFITLFLLLVINTGFLHPQTVPNPPANLTANSVYSYSMNLNWADSSNNETGFRIEKSNNGIIFAFAANVGPNVTAFTDNSLSPYTIYFYRVCAYNTNGNSSFSNTAQDTTLIDYSTCAAGVSVNPATYPFSTGSQKSRSQFLYKRSEFYGGCYSYWFSALGFFFDSVSSQIMNGLTIKLQGTTDTVITGFKNTGWTTVYNGNYTVPGKGWKFLPTYGFTLPPNQNLLVEICFDNSSATYNSIVLSSFYPGKSVCKSANTGAGCTLDSGIAYNYRPNMRHYNVINTIIKISQSQPDKFVIEQNYPNPFNSGTKFRFSVKEAELVTIRLFDIQGRNVTIIAHDFLKPGVYEKTFSTADFVLASGVYYYSFTAGDFRVVKKLVYLK